jgi:hypothetical protein
MLSNLIDRVDNATKTSPLLEKRVPNVKFVAGLHGGKAEALY